MIIAACAGESPLHILNIFYNSAFGSPYDLGLTLFYTTSFIFTGLSVAIAFHAGLFNIGAEGQLTMGVLAASWVGVSFPNLAFPLAPLLAVVAAAMAGALWGFIPGWLKAYRHSHEVIITMMMNFIAAGISSYVVLNLIKNNSTQNPESAPVAASYMLSPIDFIQNIFTDSPANFSLVLALALAVAVYLFLEKTAFGFEIKASGQNEEASHLSGIESKKIRVWAMVLAGAFAGLVAVNEVLGSAGRFRMGFSVDYGFVGIAVALMARSNPLGIILSSFLFGVLQKGASDLDIETAFITRDFAKVMQATLIFSVAAFYFLDLKGVKKWISHRFKS